MNRVQRASRAAGIAFAVVVLLLLAAGVLGILLAGVRLIWEAVL